MDGTRVKKQRTVVDRSVSAILANPDDTASRRDGIKIELERLHRIQGCSLILTAARLLKCPVASTACSIFHQFYHQASLKNYEAWGTALACLILSTKVEEKPIPMHHAIVIFHYLYRKRRLVCTKGKNGGICGNNCIETSEKAAGLSSVEKEEALRDIKPLSQLGPIYAEWMKSCTRMENVILRQLGFSLYWIPNSHPHRFLLYFVKALDTNKSSELAQLSWNYCNDCQLLDLCNRFVPEVIACAAIHLAGRDLRLSLPEHPQPWWDSFVDKGNDVSLADICHAVRGLHHPNDDVIAAMIGFVPPLTEDGSFNDSDSFLWSKED